MNWFDFGLQLRLKECTLKKIEKEQMKGIEDCKREMLSAWLKNSANTNKQEIRSALSRTPHST